MEKTIKGLICNIQDYSVHDGCGLRSIVFLKGCPLRCAWCQNPECINSKPEVIFRPQLCIDCKKCFEVCPEDALLDTLDSRIDRNKCTGCLKCVEVCPSAALKKVGTVMTSEEVIKEILQYKAFYDASENGGVTFSGGEPLFQVEFIKDLLKKCKSYGLHVAMETCLYADTEIIMDIISYLDLLLCDIKHMDEAKHKEGTGVSNRLILDNLKKICQQENRPECVIRIPLIPGYNDDEENIEKTAVFVKSLGIKQIDLLPFNDLAGAKYRELNQNWPYADTKQQPPEVLDKLAKIIEKQGLTVTIGGLW